MVKKGLTLLIFAVLAISTVISGCASDKPTTGGTHQNTANATSGPQYPTKQIEIVVPFAAGGGVDLVARAVADTLSKDWGQPIIIVNKPGGGGVTGAQAALKQASPDGYTVLAHSVSNTTMLSAGMANPAIKLEDNVFVARVVEDPVAFVVKADAPWKDFREFSEWVKQNPEKLTWNGAGPASISAFAVAEWLNKIGVDYSKTRMIPIQGSADSIPKVAGGHSVLAVHSVYEVSSLVKSGKVKILAVQGTNRNPFFPDVPTAEEMGVKGLHAKFWSGISMPVGTPDYIVKKWEEAMTKMVEDPAFIEKLKNMSVAPSFLNKEGFNNFVKEDAAYWTDLATQIGIRK